MKAILSSHDTTFSALTCVVLLPFIKQINKKHPASIKTKLRDKIRRLFLLLPPEMKQEINISSVLWCRVCGCEILRKREWEIYLLISHNEFNCCSPQTESAKLSQKNYLLICCRCGWISQEFFYFHNDSAHGEARDNCVTSEAIMRAVLGEPL